MQPFFLNLNGRVAIPEKKSVFRKKMVKSGQILVKSGQIATKITKI